jgi:transposase
MATPSRTKKHRRTQPHVIHKPRGVLHPRVQKVGPEHFGVVSVDCAKARSKWMLADFYGRVLVPPTVVEHNQTGFEAALRDLREAIDRHALKDLVVAIERTGCYHRSVQHAFAKAAFEVRIVHPFATKQFRQPADPGNKTDDTDLSAIHRAAVNGFGLLEHEPDPLYVRIQLLARHRRDLVGKSVTLRNQIGELIQTIMPGYAKCFNDVFDGQVPLWVAREFGSADAILQAGPTGLTRRLREADIRAHAPTPEKIVAWARTAPAIEGPASIYQRILIDADDDRLAKLRRIRMVEGELAGLLVQTPYVLLLGVPGINIISAAEFAGEMGPIERYPKARTITGRAGLFPARHQSDQVDFKDGVLIRSANRNLRQAIMRIADNLIVCNDHFRVLAAQWRIAGKDPRDIHVKVGGRFCRIAYQMVAGRSVYRHPCCQQRHYVIWKLLKFSNEHNIELAQVMRDLDAATSQLPRSEYCEEAAPLAEELARAQTKRGAGPQRLGEILPAVLAKLGVGLVKSPESGETDLT